MPTRNLARRFGPWLVLLLCLTAAPALGSEIDDAKAAGHIGEQADGYLGLVSSSAPESAKALVHRVNAGRKKRYAEIGAKNGTNATAVGARAGAKLIELAVAGVYVNDGSGWKKK